MIRSNIIAEYFNDLLHQEPFDFLIEGVFWWFLLVFVGPIVGIFQLLGTILQFGWYMIVVLVWDNRWIEPPLRDNEQLAVVITGCDSGFGQELAFQLASKHGFVVFCGCLSKDSFAQFDGESNCIPLKMDVTNDEEVTQAAKVVSDWLNNKEEAKKGEEKASKQKKRYLHAIVNNAGISYPGFIDWNDLAEYQRVMDVNYFAILRCTKALLPTLKHQASSGEYSQARILNVVSCAGILAPIPFASTYNTSKWAAECLTHNMRKELINTFGIHVTAIDPSFHETPLVINVKNEFLDRWNRLPAQTKEEYGQEYIDTIEKLQRPKGWKSRVVVKEMTKCILLKKTPARMLVGSDAKLIMHPLSKIPHWWLPSNRPIPKPAMMMKQS